MNFIYSRQHLSAREQVLERLLEIVPGALSWSIIFGMVALSVARPLAAAIIVIAFLLYWLLRLLYLNIFLVVSYIRLAVERHVPWGTRIEKLDRLDEYAREAPAAQPQDFRNKNVPFLHFRQVMAFRNAGLRPPPSGEIYHLVIIPVIRESRDIIEPGIAGIVKGDYPSERILVVIALEESAPEQVKADVRKVAELYRKDLLDLFVSVHPGNIPGEARVKGANATHAAKQAAAYFKERHIPYERVLVSCFDADTVPTWDYFSCLTYHFMVTPQRTQASFQPIPVYHNNIWEAPAFARVIDIGTSFFELVEATNPNTLVTFSSHSMSFKALVDVGYWPVDMISDDSAIFWKAFIHYDGEYRVVPIYTTVSMDIATGRTFWETCSNIYKQKRRWAWGVENFPIVVRAFLKSKKIPLGQKVVHGAKLLDAFVSWATWSVLLTFVSWLPAVFAGQEFASSTIYYTAPRIRGTIFSLASIGILVCMLVSLALLPRRPGRQSLFSYVRHVVEWLFIPVIVLVFSALPALDAQTRLLFGRTMEFWVTEKVRKR